MARGQKAEVGDTRVAPNGYHYTKVGDDHPRAQNGWILTHWLTAEKKLGRHLTENESVRFVDKKFKRDPHNPDGVIVIQKRSSSLRKRRAVLQDRIRELQAELDSIERELGS